MKGYIDKIGEQAYAAGEAFVSWVDTTLVPAVQRVFDYFGSAKGQAQIKSWADAFKNAADMVQSLIGKIDTLFKLLDKLPSNIILQKLGLIPKLSDLTSGDTGPLATKGGVRKGAATAYKNETQRKGSGSAARSQVPAGVIINITNGKQEKALDSAALRPATRQDSGVLMALTDTLLIGSTDVQTYADIADFSGVLQDGPQRGDLIELDGVAGAVWVPGPKGTYSFAVPVIMQSDDEDTAMGQLASLQALVGTRVHPDPHERLRHLSRR